MSTATIHDVARQAAVSSRTVSRVLRGHPSVSTESMERVLRAMEDLNYAPRHRKSTMADAHSLERKNVLMLFLGEERSVITLPVVASVTQGVQNALEAVQADLSIAEVPAADHVPKVMDRKSFDGVIIKGKGPTNPELLERLRGIPTVWILGRTGEWGDLVKANDMLVGKIAADYLLWKGHRRLAFINPHPSHNAVRQHSESQSSFDIDKTTTFATATGRRQASFTFFAQEAGAEVKAYLGEPRDWSVPSPAVNRIEMVMGLVDRILAEKQPPTAIFAPIDSIGATVARALSARGLQAGRDISLMSCNNEQPLFMGIHPTLTTIDIHAYEIGRRAVDQLAWRLTHLDQPRCEVGIEPTLVEGESVATL